MINQNPRGGTELQFEYLRKHVDSKLLDQFQICTSVPESIPLSKDKINILWQKNSYDQPNLAPWFKDKSNHNKYDWYVFNSNWTFEKFTKVFNLPTEKCLVIKNGVDTIEPISTIYKKGDPIKIIHHCTPWRGLSVLLGAMQLVKNPLISLDVYSSTEVYGKSFYDQTDDQYKPLYDQARQLPNVNYIGYKPNEYIKKHLKDYRLFVYPSIWEETFCISAMESLAAGQLLITTDLGALPETCAEFPIYIPYTKDKDKLAIQLQECILQCKEMLKTDLSWGLKFQQEYYQRYYDWKIISRFWTDFLKGALTVKRKQK